MTNLSYEEQNKYRVKIKQKLESHEGAVKASVCNPVDYFTFEEVRHQSQKEIMEFDLNKVRNSDLLIVNFNDPRSLGTMAELAIAYEHRIPIIGLNEQYSLNGLEMVFSELHPWQQEMSSRIFNDIDELIEYVINFYLN